MKKFRSFIERNIADGDMTGSKRFASKRFVLAWVYFAIHIVFNSIVSKLRFNVFPRSIKTSILTLTNFIIYQVNSNILGSS